MDGENNGKPYLQMDDLGGKPTIFWKPPYGLAPFLDLCLAKSPQDLDLCRIFKNTFFPKLVTIPSTFLWGAGSRGGTQKFWMFAKNAMWTRKNSWKSFQNALNLPEVTAGRLPQN